MRVLRWTAPPAAIGIVLIIVLRVLHVPDVIVGLIVVPTMLAFFVAWLTGVALWLNQLVDIPNRFRRGSARAYDDE